MILIRNHLIVSTSAAGPELLFSDQDPTWRVITDPDPTLRVITDSDPDPT